jgi:hypothetical protein
MLKRFLFCAVGIALSTGAMAEESLEATALRPVERFGLYTSVLGDPSPSFLGINLTYTLTPEVRLTAGLGTMTAFGTSLGAGVKGILMPDRPLTPFFGVSLSRTTYYDFFSSWYGETSQPNQVVWNGFLSAGGEWQANEDLYLALGANWKVIGPDGVTVQVFPFLNLGTYF